MSAINHLVIMLIFLWPSGVVPPAVWNECCYEAQFVSEKLMLAFAARAPLEDTAYSCTEGPSASLAGKLSVLSGVLVA